MKLKVRDQINVTSVQSETLRPGDQIEVMDAEGEALMKAHPAAFVKIPEPKGAAKQAPTPENKAAPAHADKAVIGVVRKSRAKSKEK